MMPAPLPSWVAATCVERISLSVEHACARRRSTLGQWVETHQGGLSLQVIEDLLDQHRVFDAGNDLDGAAAFTTGLDVDIEYTLQSLRPGHRCPALSGRLVRCFIGHSGFVALASPRGRYHCTVLAVRREHAMKASQIDAGLRHQRRQSGDEVQRLEQHMGGTVAIVIASTGSRSA